MPPATQPRPIVYAHRGARGHAPENTLLAFALAFTLGADAIECDVQRSSDGQLVIIHDDTLNRTTDGHGPVRGVTLTSLRGFTAGRLWNLPVAPDTRIPTLEETLALVEASGREINLEVKGETIHDALGTAESVAPVLGALAEEMRPRLLVSSFAHPAVALLKERLPWLRVAPLYDGARWRREDMIAPALEMGAEAIHPGFSLLTPSLMQRAHASGLKVNVWTANRWADIRKLLSWEVDGVFSDLPERVVIARALAAARQP